MCAETRLFYPVELSAQRDVLKHTWIDNGIINKCIDRILDLWLDGLRWKSLDQEFPSRLDEAERFGDVFVDGFSSAKLVELLAPFTKLPKGERDRLSAALDEIYHQSANLVQLQLDYRSALASLRSAIDELRDAWDLHRPQGVEQVRQCASRLNDAAVLFQAVMERIPKGVVIP